MESNCIQMIHTRNVGCGVCRLVVHTGLKFECLGEVTDKGRVHVWLCRRSKIKSEKIFIFQTLFLNVFMSLIKGLDINILKGFHSWTLLGWV